MKYRERDITFLTEAEGEVVDYSMHGIPKLLENTLKMSSSGINAKMSGRRSALLRLGKKWYKLKGCNPQPGLFSHSDWFPIVKDTLLDEVDATMKPKGSMNVESAKSELEEQLKIVEKLGEFNLTAPLYPVARYDYAMENRACAVSITKGDLRLPEFRNRFLEINHVIPNYKQQFNIIYQWLGFAQYITKETFGRLGKTSNGVFNYIFYEIPKGYALMRTDFAHRPEPERILKPDFFGNHEHHIVEYLTKHKYSQPTISKILEDFEVEERTAKRIVSPRLEHYVVNIPKNKLPDKKDIMKYFQKGLDGEMPEPISKSFIVSVF